MIFPAIKEQLTLIGCTCCSSIWILVQYGFYFHWTVAIILSLQRYAITQIVILIIDIVAFVKNLEKIHILLYNMDWKYYWREMDGGARFTLHTLSWLHEMVPTSGIYNPWESELQHEQVICIWRWLATTFEKYTSNKLSVPEMHSIFLQHLVFSTSSSTALIKNSMKNDLLLSVRNTWI